MPDMKVSQLSSGAPWVGTHMLYVATAGGLPRKLTIAELFTNPVFSGVVALPNIGTGDWISLPNATSTWKIRAAAAGVLGIYNDVLAADAIKVTEGGLVGIGMTPATALDVAGRGTFRYSSAVGDRLSLDPLAAGSGCDIRSLNFGATAYAPLSLRASFISLMDGSVGIGMTPTVQFELSGSTGQKASGTTWSNPSDARVKENIAPADLDRCYAIVKSIPLKRYTLKPEAFSDARVRDRSRLGWIAQEVQPLFAKAVKAHTFQMEPVPDGFEEIDEPVLEEEAPAEEAYVEIIDGVPVQKTRVVAKSVPVVDMVPLIDELGSPVLEDVEEPVELDGVQMLDGAGALLTRITQRQVMYPVPRMRKVQLAKVRRPEIPDCLALDADQIYAAMYGAVQRLIQKVEALEAQLAAK